MQQWGPRVAVIVGGVLVGLVTGFGVGAGFEWPSEEELAEAQARLDAANAQVDAAASDDPCAPVVGRLEARRDRARTALGRSEEPSRPTAPPGEAP